MRARRSAIVAACAVAVALMPGATLGAYLKLGTEIGDRLVTIRWTRQPIRYFITNRAVAGVTENDLRTAVSRAFATWGRAPGVTVESQFAGFVGSEPFAEDGASVIGFRARADLDTTLGATTFTIDATTGDVIESDIFLNTAFTWSVAPGGTSGRFDVESIMLHEIGHLLGLGHSALGETETAGGERRQVIAKGAVMFPIAYPPGTTQDRALQPDDEAGIGELYGGSSFTRDLGSIGGRVTKNGTGIFGAHVTAFNPQRGMTIGSFSLDDDGAFVLSGLEAGVYIVRAEPLDDADTDSFFEDDGQVDAGFLPTYFEKLVIVPNGGTSPRIDIRVRSR